MTFKMKFLSFMTKVNPKNGNKTKSDIFPWDILKSDAISFLSKNIKVILVSLMTKLK